MNDTTKSNLVPMDYPVEYAGRAPEMTAREQRDWNNLFKLMNATGRLLDPLDSLLFSEIPPPFINDPWNVSMQPLKKNGIAIEKSWPNYKAMRDDYQQAGMEIISEYERVAGMPPAVGWVLPAALAVTTIVFVALAVKQAFETEAALAALEERKTDLEILDKHGSKVAKSIGMKWPAAVARLSTALIVGALVAAGIYFYGKRKK